MKDVLMMVHTMGTLEVTDNDRFTYIARMLMEKNAKVEMITSDFEHHKKCYRNQAVANQHPFKITFLHENSYKKNISFKRIAGHISFAKRLKKYLKNRELPDVIYCAVPPTFSALVIARYAEKNGIKFIIDVQDLWPESFKIALGDNLISRTILMPIASVVNGVYKRADAIIAVSDTYVSRVLQNNKHAKEKLGVYLGTDERVIDSRYDVGKVSKNKDDFWIGYIGNLGNSYDFEHLFEALANIYDSGIMNIKFWLVGDGVRREELEKLSQKYFKNTEITGYLPYSKMLEYLKNFDVAVNPIKKGTANSVVNKVGDYAAMGVPVVNTQDNQEYRELLNRYEAGVNTLPENTKDIQEKIMMLYENAELRNKMGENNRRLFEDKFNRRITYPRIVKCIIE